MNRSSAFSILICGAFFGLAPVWAAADVSGSMQEFWRGMGGDVNVSNSATYQGQSAGYYTLGNIHARTPVKNLYPLSVQLPHARGGCGGIDLFQGAASYLNAEQLVAAIKSIANNSSGFAFQLALETISPVIAEKVEELQGWAQKINAMNINSCETAASLVGGIWPQHDRASATVCASMGNGSGLFKDYAEAKHACETGGKRADTNRRVAKEADSLPIEDVNIAWKALKDSGFFGTNENALAELFMTLSGTIIIHAPDADNVGPKYEFISARIAHSDIITTLLDGGDIKTHTCGETEKCLQVTKEGGIHRISPETAFKVKVQNLLESMIDKIREDTALSPQELALLNMTSIPIYKTLNVYAAYSGAGTIFELPVYAEAIALQILYEYLNSILRQVTVSADRLVLASDLHLDRFKTDLREARKALSEREIKSNQTYAALMQLIDRTMMIEGMLSRQMGTPLVESLQWSRKF